MFSCKNKDLIILKSQKNCGCSDIIYNEYKKEVSDYVQKYGMTVGPSKFDCNNPFYEQPVNDELFFKTSTLELKNNSQTKVYEVLIQINENNKIRYEEYNIQPTDVLELGCDSNFKISFNYTLENSRPIEALKLSNLSKIKILYKIHKIKLISEY